MSQSQTAIDLVYESLRNFRDRGVELRASTNALERLSQSQAAGPGPAMAPMPAIGLIGPIGPMVSAGPRDGAGKTEALAALREPVLVCVKCPHLAATRTQVVFGVGDPNAELMFVGEAPGEEEDLQGEPFVGNPGQLQTKIIETMGFSRESVYIANVLKCRPDMPPGESGNRKPRKTEMETCLPYLRAQIEIIRPRVIVALGASAMEGLLGETQPMGKLRGRWHEFAGIPLMATYHPSYLLRNQALGEKRKVWEDMLLVLQLLGRPISPKQQSYFLPKA